ncbi:nickel pincer cofactor biosynthesis protein LarB [Halalkalicoccus jeotgali]|uniref:1-(5-phosphoribosyl)-5-amino-4-imidazole-carboxylate (AIR) carboxylase n=1 Tax=Halalkalicoccus jeotgali (strain DSM 18796 / CECT 7217 / JCM 14584 / KCTC 4019 / B3) TaxID=795797 RepID=D8J533_HALJB|nr:nickel pincer cofactor biosynthesis protein LarB [Halalkalicoccus jeotgali]ADJ13614.1 1-(5-phosphoribosyl)-5-amino-4-imidazole- carboxylate (AIR) carboxylase [Halalkalicoccus jeotgali B3]ELY33364.1 1-(5-phosphoribosyl)-5-amino-4-imidazole- carboxylate (AIR) carboxylase [Halalkalicoccus jeotgali B3]
MGLRDILDDVHSGELTPEEAQARLAGYARTEAGRFDAARESRRGIPEAIFAPGKTTEEIAALAETALETTGRAVITRVDGEAVTALETVLDGEVTHHERARCLVVHAQGFEPPELDASVGVVTGGTADRRSAGEAAVIAGEIGARVERIEDVGVANLSRVIDQLPRLREMDVLVVAAGREGALPTVVAGLVSTPVIGLPVSSGYGFGAGGEAALLGMLQSCSVLSVVNVDAGYVAGTQAGLIASAIADARP